MPETLMSSMLPIGKEATVCLPFVPPTGTWEPESGSSVKMIIGWTNGCWVSEKKLACLSSNHCFNMYRSTEPLEPTNKPTKNPTKNPTQNPTKNRTTY